MQSLTHSCSHSKGVVMGIVDYVWLAEISSVERPCKVRTPSDNKSLAIGGVFEVRLARGL